MNEGDTVDLPIHLTNYAYNEPFRDDLARAYNLRINVPDNFKDDISFENVDPERSSWDDTNKIFKIRTRPVTTLGTPPNIPASPPVLSASLRVLVKKDEIPEMPETIPITMEAAANSNIPGDWGSINPDPDDRATNPLEVSTTFTISVPANDTFVGFAEDAPAEIVEESESVQVKIIIRPRLAAAATILLRPSGTASEGGDYTITSEHYNANTDILTLPVNTDDVTLTITPMNDLDADNGKTIQLMLQERPGDDALPDDRPVEPAAHTVTIRDEDRSVGFAEIAPIRGVGDVHEGMSLPISIAPADDDKTAFGNLSLQNGVDLMLEISVSGDPELSEEDRLDPANAQDYSVPRTVRLDGRTGESTIDFRVNDDRVT